MVSTGESYGSGNDSMNVHGPGSFQPRCILSSPFILWLQLLSSFGLVSILNLFVDGQDCCFCVFKPEFNKKTKQNQKNQKAPSKFFHLYTTRNSQATVCSMAGDLQLILGSSEELSSLFSTNTLQRLCSLWLRVLNVITNIFLLPFFIKASPNPNTFFLMTCIGST